MRICPACKYDEICGISGSPKTCPYYAERGWFTFPKSGDLTLAVLFWVVLGLLIYWATLK